MLFEKNRVIFFLDVQAFVFNFLTVLHHYHERMADTAGREALLFVSGRVSFLATGETVTPRNVPGQGNTKRSTEELWNYLA